MTTYLLAMACGKGLNTEMQKYILLAPPFHSSINQQNSMLIEWEETASYHQPDIQSFTPNVVY